LLSLKNVTVAYDSVVAVEDVSFDVEKGDFFCVVGANGSGKSTLIRGVLGLEPLLRGMVSFGVDRDRVSWVPQIEAADRGFPATVREIVLTGMQKRGGLVFFYTAEDRRSAGAAMEFFELGELAGRQIGELSGGQHRRMMLARAMCRDPDLLLLDEPCAGLDADAKSAFYAKLDRLRRERGATIVMVSHDPDDVALYATRVAVLERRLVFLGGAEEWRDGKRGKHEKNARGGFGVSEVPEK
jgi:zinc transport system ATP-binding protein